MRRSFRESVSELSQRLDARVLLDVPGVPATAGVPQSPSDDPQSVRKAGTAGNEGFHPDPQAVPFAVRLWRSGDHPEQRRLY
jgi:hypothetical protein